jgi:hypothetical protein
MTGARLAVLALAVTLVLAGVWLLPARSGERGRGVESVVEHDVVRPGPELVDHGASPPATQRAPLGGIDGSAQVVESRAVSETASEPPESAARFFHGLVVDARTGSPVADARALVVDGEPQRSPVELAPPEIQCEARSDALGRVTLPVLSRGRGGAGLVLAEGYGVGEFLCDDRRGSPDRPFVVELLPEAGLELRASDERGQPVRGVALDLAWEAEPVMRVGWMRSASELARWNASTDECGVAFLRGLPAERELRWRVTTTEGQTIRAGIIALDAGEIRVIAAVLGHGATISGRVLDERDQPVEGVSIDCEPAHDRMTFGDEPFAETQSDAHGLYAFEHLAPDAYVLSIPSESGYVQLEPRSRVVLERTGIERDLRVASGRFLAGRIDGRPEETSRLTFVFAHAADGSASRASDMVNDSTFRIGPLAPGAYDVWASGSGSMTARVRAAAGQEDVVLVAEPTPEIEIGMEGAEGKVDLASHDLETGFVTMWDTQETRSAVSLAPGRHVLVAEDASGRTAAARVVATGERASGPVVLVLRPGAAVVLVHRASDRARHVRVHVGDTPLPLGAYAELERELAPGAAWSQLLPPGLLVAELLEDGRVVARVEVALAPGERRRVELVPGR